jgi:hypothetical protein
VGGGHNSDIKKNSESFQLFVPVLESEDGSSSRKTMKKADNVKVEEASGTELLEIINSISCCSVCGFE